MGLVLEMGFVKAKEMARVMETDWEMGLGLGSERELAMVQG